MMKEAAELGDELIVLINNDTWLRDKKGYRLVNEMERKAVIQDLEYVDRVELTTHGTERLERGDTSIRKELKEIKPDVFANGGDRGSQDIPEHQTCLALDIDMEFHVGKEKTISSSFMFWDAVRQAAKSQFDHVSI